MRQVFFQTCTEYGQYGTSATRLSFFGETINVDYFVEICATVFGTQFTRDRIEENIERFNVKFGGNNPEVTNAIFSSSIRDPLRLLNPDTWQLSDVFHFPTGSKCGNHTNFPNYLFLNFLAFQFGDLQSIEETDSDTVRGMKEHIRTTFQLWIWLNTIIH